VPASQEGIGVEQRGTTGRAKVDELTLAQTATHPAIAKPVTPKVEPPPVPGKPPRKPMSRQELQKLSDEIVRQRKLRETRAKK
jgi:hypothetical protein